MIQQQWPSMFPPLPNTTDTPHWTGCGFQIGDRILPILSYETSASGWTDDMTTFHENTVRDSRFIDLASRHHVMSQVAQYTSETSSVILDIGYSSGFLLADLGASFPQAYVMDADVILSPLLNLAETISEIPLLHFDLMRCPLPDNSVDVAILLNILEHIEDDALAVRQLFCMLKPGGIAIIKVPAGLELFDIYDELLMHYRRYKLPGLRHLFLDAGFSTVRQSHLVFFLYPGFFVVKQSHLKKRADILEEEIPALVSQNINQTGDNLFFHALMHIELAIIDVFNHSYPVQHAPADFATTHKIGVGLGRHLKYEKLMPEQCQNYFCLDLRANIAEVIHKTFPNVQAIIHYCREPMSMFTDGYFDRVLAIHVLERLPNLPAAIREVYGLINKQKGIFSVVISCEGGLSYGFAHCISARRIFEKRYKQPSKWFIEHEHINLANEILEELQPYFEITHRTLFPLPFLPVQTINLVIGLTLKPRLIPPASVY